MDRFFHPAGLSRSILSLDEAESHHAARVLRKQPGDRVELFDGRGQSAIGEITLAKKDRVEVRILELREPLVAPQPAIRLAVAPPKGDRFRWLVEKATELGIDQLIPLLTERTVVEPGAGKLDKLQAAVVAACKQSGRDLVMQVLENTPFAELLVANRSATNSPPVAEPRTRVCVPHVGAADSAPSPHWGLEFQKGHGCGERAGVRGESLTPAPLTPALSPAIEPVPNAASNAGERGPELASHRRLERPASRTLLIGDPQGAMFQPEMIPHGSGEVLLLIGPEGGWSEAELEHATQAGATRVRIADQILRTETAAIQLAGLCVWARSRG